jgi:selenocysteine-specific elongation factor
MRVIGTAGHVDHGKSTLVHSLTGIHPDRLKEEREREMTIDLGFAWFTLPGGEEVGIVDVPGHRDFIENMLAGIGGIDAALFVIACDEGIMPQTREHLAILDLLQINSGVIALTKIDLVDLEWLELVEDDIRQVVRGTVLEHAPIVRVSAITRQGIPRLLEEIANSLAEKPHRIDNGRPRLPIDRVFTMTGFGTIVTGTLTDGQLKTGDDIEILPPGYRGRVRGLQTHKHKEDQAVPGSRTAVNISGVSLEKVNRGFTVAHPGDYHPTRRIDVQFRLLRSSSQSLKHNVDMKIFLGTAETVARVRLLGVDELLPGQQGWLQLELSDPVITVRGDRYILRRPSPGETIGGGIIIDPNPTGRHKRFAQKTIETLSSLAQGSPADILLQAAVAAGPVPLKDIITRSNLDESVSVQALKTLMEQGLLFYLENYGDDSAEGANGSPMISGSNEIVISRNYWEQISSRINQEVNQYHAIYPLRPGIPREELKSRLKIVFNSSPRVFNALISRLITLKDLEEIGPLIKRHGFRIQFTPQQKLSEEKLLDRFLTSPFATPSIKDCQAEVGEDLFQALLETGKLIAVSSDVVFRKEDYDRFLVELRRMINQSGPISAAQVRDHFNTSRKYVLALLEYLDAQGITIREGDYRRLKS